MGGHARMLCGMGGHARMLCDMVGITRMMGYSEISGCGFIADMESVVGGESIEVDGE